MNETAGAGRGARRSNGAAKMSDAMSKESIALSSALSAVVGMDLVILSATRLQAIREALKPFADFVDAARAPPDSFVITQGSGMARRQLTVGDCRRAGAVLELLNEEAHLNLEAPRG
jgi:hypothetical protein